MPRQVLHKDNCGSKRGYRIGQGIVYRYEFGQELGIELLSGTFEREFAGFPTVLGARFT